MRLLTLSALLLSTLVACNGRSGFSVTDVGIDTGGREDIDDELNDSLGGDWEESLHLTAACGDTQLYLWNESMDLGLEVDNAGFMERADGQGLRETFEIGYDDVEVKIEWATPVAINYCAGDAPAEPRELIESWRAVEGAVVMEVSWDDDGVPWVSLDLWNTRFEDAEGQTVTEPHLEVNDIPFLD